MRYLFIALALAGCQTVPVKVPPTVNLVVIDNNVDAALLQLSKAKGVSEELKASIKRVIALNAKAEKQAKEIK